MTASVTAGASHPLHACHSRVTLAAVTPDQRALSSPPGRRHVTSATDESDGHVTGAPGPRATIAKLLPIVWPDAVALYI